MDIFYSIKKFYMHKETITFSIMPHNLYFHCTKTKRCMTPRYWWYWITTSNFLHVWEKKHIRQTGSCFLLLYFTNTWIKTIDLFFIFLFKSVTIFEVKISVKLGKSLSVAFETLGCCWKKKTQKNTHHLQRVINAPRQTFPLWTQHVLIGFLFC